jgi:hypothetical protein
MASTPTAITELRRQLSASRAHLAQTSSGISESIGASLDVPARVRRHVVAHPVKWAVLALAGGVVAARLLPPVLGLVRSAASRRLVGTLLTTVAPVALRAGVNALASRRPDLAAFFHGDAPDPSEPPAGGG